MRIRGSAARRRTHLARLAGHCKHGQQQSMPKHSAAGGDGSTLSLHLHANAASHQPHACWLHAPNCPAWQHRPTQHLPAGCRRASACMRGSDARHQVRQIGAPVGCRARQVWQAREAGACGAAAEPIHPTKQRAQRERLVWDTPGSATARPRPRARVVRECRSKPFRLTNGYVQTSCGHKKPALLEAMVGTCDFRMNWELAWEPCQTDETDWRGRAFALEGARQLQCAKRVNAGQAPAGPAASDACGAGQR